MDKQKQIEEMAKDLKQIKFNMQGYFIPQYVGVHEDITARDLYDLGYRKIPENAVVLTDKRDIQQFEWSKLVDKMGVFKLIEKECAKIRKETAEKFAERLKEKMDNQQYILLPTATMKYMIDEICKEITGGKE